MYQKMSNYTNDNSYNYSYQTNDIRKLDNWSNYEPINYDNHQADYTTHNYAPQTYSTQNDIKRFKLNNYGGYIEDLDYWNGQHVCKSDKKTHLQCDTKVNSTTKPINSPASSTNLSMSSNESVTNEHLSLCDSLHKAFQAGHLTKSRYRRLIANERERNRMHGLNVAFENLRSVLPSLGSSKQFSKYETLQMASNYINALREIILNDDLNSGCNNKKF